MKTIKGHWRYERHYVAGSDGKEYRIHVTSNEGEHIAEVAKEEDARLIAVAPQLLEILEACTERLCDVHAMPTELRVRVLDVLTKAYALIPETKDKENHEPHA